MPKAEDEEEEDEADGVMKIGRRGLVPPTTIAEALLVAAGYGGYRGRRRMPRQARRRPPGPPRACSRAGCSSGP